MKLINKIKIPSSNTILIFLSLFFIIRFFSFLTYTNPIINQIIALIVIVIFTIIATKKISIAWLILIIEILLDGSGHFLELGGLILRTWFLGIFAIIWLTHKYQERKIQFNLPRPILYGLFLTLLSISLAIILGIYNHHNLHLILQDAILYLFLLLAFPALEFDKFSDKYFLIAIKTFIIGSALFSILTFIIYSSGLGSLPDNYYHWFRNIASGKITDLGWNFFRIVLPEHLLIVPIILIIASYLIKNPTNKLYWLGMFLSLIILDLNFTRIYFLTLAFGLLILFYKNPFKRWLTVCATTTVLMISIFILTALIASRGHSFGQHILGFKISGISSPNSDISGTIRLSMLPNIYETISHSPFIGSGLATMVSYTDPTTKKVVSRTQFDWGYFEMIAELGIIGLTIFLSFIFILLYYLGKLAYSNNKNSSLYRGLFAGALSLFVINITTPALFHGFGILYFVYLLSII